MRTLPRRFRAGIAVACVVALAAACGNDRAQRIEFRITPIPVTALPDGTPVSIDANCNVFSADLVGVSLDAKNRQTFEAWLDDIGFEIVSRDGTPGRNGPLYSDTNINFTDISYLIGVPPGSVPDAVTLIKKQRGVRIAEPNAFGWIPEDGPPGWRFFGCTPAAG